MFYDIPKLNYADMVERAKKPYRGSNASPLGWREYSARHFRPLKDEEGFSIHYCTRTVMDEIESNTAKHAAWYKPFAIVRPDNTIEFIKPTSAQSENMILRRMLSTPVYHEKARGGTCIRGSDYSSTNHIMHPMFEGLRIDMNTLEASKPYELYVRKLIQKEAKAYLKQYDEFKTVALTMFNAMNVRGVSELIDEIKTSKKVHNDAVFSAISEKHYVDALAHFILRKYNYWTWADITESRLNNLRSVVKESLENDFDDFVLARSNVPFKLVQVEASKYFSVSKWGYTIVQDGKEMVRY